MKVNRLAMGSLLLAASAVAFSLSTTNGDATVVELPASARTAKTDAGASVASGMVDAPTPERVDLAVTMTPPTVAEAPVESKPRVTKNVTALVDSGLSQEIADALLQVAQIELKKYEILSGSHSDSQITHLMEFFLSVWPDLSKLIRSGRVKPVIAKLPAEAINYARGLVWYMEPGESAEACINTDGGWQIRLVFTATNHDLPDLFARAMKAEK